MKAKLLPIGLTAIAILATPVMVVSSARQAQANSSCSQQPNDQNCNHKDPVEQGCNDAATVLVAKISDNSGKVIGEVDLRWSDKCKSNWARVVSNIGAASISATVTRQSDGLSDSFSSNQYSGIYTNMLYSPGPAKACGVINGYQNCASQYDSPVGRPDFSKPAYRSQNPFWPNWAPRSVGGYLDSPGNCTWYANGRLRELGGYKSSVLDRLLGNADQWPAQGQAAGAILSRTPQVGAIAQWNDNVGGAGSLGHVAVVEKVNSDGSVVISESNWNNQLYDQRTLRPGTSSWPSQFILVPRG